MAAIDLTTVYLEENIMSLLLNLSVICPKLER
jgi:hypothetical protein